MTMTGALSKSRSPPRCHNRPKLLRCPGFIIDQHQYTGDNPQAIHTRNHPIVLLSIRTSYIPSFPTYPLSKPLLEMAVFSAVADFVRLPWFGPVLILISILGIAAQKYRAYRRLAHFQGPPGAAWTELWLARVTWQSRIHTTLRDVNEKYGTASGQSLLYNTGPFFGRRAHSSAT